MGKNAATFGGHSLAVSRFSKNPKAAADLEIARKQGADFWMTLPLAALQPAKSSPPGETAPPAPEAVPSVSGKNDN